MPKDKEKKGSHKEGEENNDDLTVEFQDETLTPSGSTDRKVIDFEESKAKIKNEALDLEIIEKELNEAKKELDDLKTTVQRTQADFINYKRRTEEERAKIAVFANEQMILELLTVVDNFERALAHPGEDGGSFAEGVELIKKQILDLLAKHLVKEIPTDIDFDPNFHYAVMQEDGEEPGKILEVFQKGYLLDEKVIRPSMVKVSK
ncbi:MAG: nucleotide exchange factor GrpE [Peptostreptococcaceae bacterium]|nr:nucleotide exchange factor GrpE [Peptostreptococcaceae bacterium]